LDKALYIFGAVPQVRPVRNCVST